MKSKVPSNKVRGPRLPPNRRHRSRKDYDRKRMKKATQEEIGLSSFDK